MSDSFAYLGSTIVQLLSMSGASVAPPAGCVVRAEGCVRGVYACGASAVAAHIGVRKARGARNARPARLVTPECLIKQGQNSLD